MVLGLSWARDHAPPLRNSPRAVMLGTQVSAKPVLPGLRRPQHTCPPDVSSGQGTADLEARGPAEGPEEAEGARLSPSYHDPQIEVPGQEAPGTPPAPPFRRAGGQTGLPTPPAPPTPPATPLPTSLNCSKNKGSFHPALPTRTQPHTLGRGSRCPQPGWRSREPGLNSEGTTGIKDPAGRGVR